MKTTENNECDGSGPHSNEPSRVLPIGGGGNVILCRRCFEREIIWRKGRNCDLAESCKFDLPNWEALRVYREA